MFLKEYNNISRSDQRSMMLVLACVILLAIALPIGIYVGSETKTTEDGVQKANNHEAIDNGNPKNVDRDMAASSYTEKRETSMALFDPNTADSIQLLRLGLRPWQVHNIYKYRAKGGVYRRKEDFARVYGLTVKEYRRLAPYIRISKDYLPAATLPEVRRLQYDRPVAANNNGSTAHNAQTYGKDESTRHTAQVKIQKGEHVSVNTSDTTMLTRIPGIGKYYARQIVNYRNRLGGYVSRNQLMEIEGLPEETLEYIEIDTKQVKRLNVNSMTLAQLKRHPYINYWQARAITEYRRLHGKIRNILDLKLMSEFTQNDLKRIEPYVEY